ncbi:CrcB-like protein-domain-containing protein [Calycina marina]|uniref:CrcB-like protein-domain-containing protein n=1 Tax=Calycina marina TaxID=1763456 RepID=A0A9P7Z0P5_9HELO|nr:CrcB-like protein-domain-containing protein [Calycina marina]
MTSRQEYGAPVPDQDADYDGDYDLREDYDNLDELAAPSPVHTTHNGSIYQHQSLEQAVSQKSEREKPHKKLSDQDEISKHATQLYTISYLILFSLLGTLARLGLQAINIYPGAPVIFSVLWPNFGGSLLMGFLSEDRMLFREEWGTPKYHQQIQRAVKQKRDDENDESQHHIDLAAAKKKHAATKKTIPLYIGLVTGFCGSFTSFSSFIRDAFLALANDLSTPSTPTIHRNGGYSLMAVLAVVITTVSSCLSALFIGAHVAVALQPITPTIPFAFGRKVLDKFVVFLAWGCWLGAILLAIFPPDRYTGGPEIWSGRGVFALVFAPVGCLGRFYASVLLNSKIASFPLGTFVVNILGTVILGMAYDLQRVPLGGVVGCQVLQGIEDGLCGCLTTVSTWVSELSTMRRRHTYVYGFASVAVALAFLVVIMGSMFWTRGFAETLCKH